MSKIKILDESVSNIIAAGEVVENPASMIKEMVENSLDASATMIRVEVFNGGLDVKISDNGVGIEEQEKEKIFERYYKRDRENQRVPGMGLGLSIIKEIVDLHNAKIELVNRNNGLDVILIFEKEEE